MQGPLLGVAGFGAVLLLIALRIPVGIAMGTVGALGYGLTYGWSSLAFVLGRAPFDSVFPVSLSVVPLFVMMGVGPKGTTFPMVIKAALPYVFCDLLAVGTLVAFPAIGTYLPSLIQH